MLFLGAHRDLEGPPAPASLAAAGTTLSLFAGPIPAGVRDTVERRLARLSQPCVEMLAAAAVVGPVVPQWILVAVLPGVDHAVLVREAIDAHVLVAEVNPWGSGAVRRRGPGPAPPGAPRGRAHDEVVSLLSQAAQTLAGQRTRLRVQVLAALAAEEFHSWREPHLHHAAVLADEAAALAYELDDPIVLASALHAQHDARWLPGSAPARREIAEEMLGLAVANGEREAEGTARLLGATALIELGDPRGRSELAAYCTLSAELGHSRDRWGATTRSATAALIAGDVEDAARLSADGVRYGLRIGEPDAHASGRARPGTSTASADAPWTTCPGPEGRPRSPAGRRGGRSRSPKRATR